MSGDDGSRDFTIILLSHRPKSTTRASDLVHCTLIEQDVD
jgi:hypothetical protein